MQAGKTRKWLTILHRKADGQPSPGKEGSITPNSVLGRQTPSLWISPPSPFSHSCYMLSMEPRGMKYPLGQSAGVSCPGCVISQLLVHPQLPHGWKCCVSTAQQQLKRPCVVYTVFSTNPKQPPPQPKPAELCKLFHLSNWFSNSLMRVNTCSILLVTWTKCRNYNKVTWETWEQQLWHRTTPLWAPANIKRVLVLSATHGFTDSMK